MGDVWILHLDTLTWAAVSGGTGKSAPPTPSQNGNAPAAEDAASGDIPSTRTLPPCAGHALVAWGNKLLVVGGHLKVCEAWAFALGGLQPLSEYFASEVFNTSTAGLIC